MVKFSEPIELESERRKPGRPAGSRNNPSGSTPDGNSGSTEKEEGNTTGASEEALQGIIEPVPTDDSGAPKGGKIRKGRPPGSKTADTYKKTLAGFWYDIHRLAGGIIDPALAWTDAEAREFGELAYEVCRSHNWLSLLDHANGARLLVLILSVETTKIKQVMEKQTNDARQSREPRTKPAIAGTVQPANPTSIRKPYEVPATFNPGSDGLDRMGG